MIKIKSEVDGRLLHIVNRLSEVNKERTDIAPPEQFLQLASLKLDKGKTFRPHQHIWKPVPMETIIAQESWVVIQGAVKVHYYDIDKKPLCDVVLFPGDISITFEGGHSYTILAKDTIVYEFKGCPYTGQANDKVFIDE